MHRKETNALSGTSRKWPGRCHPLGRGSGCDRSGYFAFGTLRQVPPDWLVIHAIICASLNNHGALHRLKPPYANHRNVEVIGWHGDFPATGACAFLVWAAHGYGSRLLLYGVRDHATTVKQGPVFNGVVQPCPIFRTN